MTINGALQQNITAADRAARAARTNKPQLAIDLLIYNTRKLVFPRKNPTVTGLPYHHKPDDEIVDEWARVQQMREEGHPLN